MIRTPIKFGIFAVILFFMIPASAMRIGATIKRYGAVLDITGFDPLKKLIAQGMELQRRYDWEKGGLEFRKKYLKESLSEQIIIESEAAMLQLKEEIDENAVALGNFFLTAEELDEAKDKIEAEIHEAAWWAELFRGCPLLMPEHIEQIEKMRQQQSKKD